MYYVIPRQKKIFFCKQSITLLICNIEFFIIHYYISNTIIIHKVNIPTKFSMYKFIKSKPANLHKCLII